MLAIFKRIVGDLDTRTRISLPFIVLVFATAYFVYASEVPLQKRMIFDVGTHYFELDYNIFSASTSLLHAFASVLYFLLPVALIFLGFGIHKFDGFTNLEKTLTFFACFIPTYFIVVSFNRVLTVFFPNIVSMWLIFISVLACLAASIRLAKDTKLDGLLIPIVCGTAGYIFFLGFELQNGPSNVIGDGAAFFIEQLQHGEILADSARIPLVDQHYDELVYLAPIHYFFAGQPQSNLFTPYLFVYALGKLSCVSFVAWFVLSVTRNGWYAVLIAIFYFLGNHLMIPFGPRLVFDQGNPLVMSHHITRDFANLFPLALVWLSGKFLDGQHGLNPAKPFHVIAVFLVGFGLAATTISNIIFVVVLVFILFLSLVPKIFQDVRPSLRSSGIVQATFLVLFLAYPILASDGHIPNRSYGALALLICTLFAMVTLLTSLSSQRLVSANARPAYLTVLIFLTGYVISFTIFGGSILQLIAHPLFSWMDQLYLAIHGDLPTLSRGLPIGKFFNGSGSDAPFFGTIAFCGMFPFHHCEDTPNYVQSFGLIFVIGAMSLVICKAVETKSIELDFDFKSDGILVLLIGLSISFLLYEFTNGRLVTMNDWLHVWVKVRFVEAWFYSLLVFGLAYFFFQASTRILAILFMLIALFGDAIVQWPVGLMELLVNMPYL